MREKEIVTAILKYQGRILILKRSEREKTYKGRWSCVSGAIKRGEDVLQAAYREIGEEVDMDKESLKFLKSYPLVEVEDRDLEIKWKVHPILFETKTEKVRLNWENSEYAWITPEEIVRYDTVLYLKEHIIKMRRL